MFSALLSFLGGSVFRLDGAPGLHKPFSLYVGFRGFFRTIKQSKIVPNTIVRFALSHVLFRVGVKANAKIARFIITSRMSKILGVGFLAYAAQIVKCVIPSIAINMVNIFTRPLPGYKKNCAPMGVVFSPANGNFPVSVWFGPPGNIARFCGSTRSQSGEISCGRVVIQNLVQFLHSKILNSHDALLLLTGQKPGSIRSRSRLCYFNEVPA